jgi:hypothetical protein
VHHHALRVDAAHHVLDRRVLPRCVESLQHHQQPVRVLRRQPHLVVREEVDAGLQHRLGFRLFVKPPRVRRVHPLGLVGARAAAVTQLARQRAQPRDPVVGHGIRVSGRTR